LGWLRPDEIPPFGGPNVRALAVITASSVRDDSRRGSEDGSAGDHGKRSTRRPHTSVEERRRYKHSECQAHEKHNCRVEREPAQAEEQDDHQAGGEEDTGDDNEQAGEGPRAGRNEHDRGDAPKDDRHPDLKTPSARPFPGTKPIHHRRKVAKATLAARSERLVCAAVRGVVTGGAGFIGSHPSDTLVAADDDLVGLEAGTACRIGAHR
jgi:hypothetical protein